MSPLCNSSYVSSRALLISLAILITACGGSGGTSSNGAMSQVPVVVEPDITVTATQDCAASSPYTLTIKGGNRISPALLDTMVCTFFEIYPKTVALLNPDAPKNVAFVFLRNWDYPASVSANVITYSAAWLNENPLDSDIVVHELTHVVQANLGEIPGWIVEGTADYVRDLYGLHNIENGWTIPIRYLPGQHYTDGYGNAAAFFKWVDALYRQGQPGVAEAIYQSGASKIYAGSIWISLTGKDLASLWDEYKNYPVTPAFNSGVSVFLATNYRGREIKLEHGNYDLAELLALAVPDNEIASIRVPAGYKIKTYTEVNFAGEMVELTEDTPALGENLTRKISSLVVE